jgi:hypothetical protein
MTKSHVSESMLDAIQVQNELFNLIREFAPKLAKRIFDKNIAISNNYWNTIRYRSLLMTFDVKENTKPDGVFPFGWRIYYDKPNILVFTEKEGNRWVECRTMNLASMNYFYAVEDKKKEMIKTFIRNSFMKIKKRVLE